MTGIKDGRYQVWQVSSMIGINYDRYQVWQVSSMRGFKYIESFETCTYWKNTIPSGNSKSNSMCLLNEKIKKELIKKLSSDQATSAVVVIGKVQHCNAECVPYICDPKCPYHSVSHQAPLSPANCHSDIYMVSLLWLAEHCLIATNITYKL